MAPGTADRVGGKHGVLVTPAPDGPVYSSRSFLSVSAQPNEISFR